MRIRMLVDMPEGAARNGEPWPALGETVEVLTAEGTHLVAAGVAEEVPAEPDKPKRRTRDVPAAEE